MRLYELDQGISRKRFVSRQRTMLSSTAYVLNEVPI
jgi:hypothetical protein